MAFGEMDLGQYLVAHNISGAQAEYIRAAARGLSRDVRPSGHASCVVEYQSFKMGVTVNTESRTAEYVYALQLEYDSSAVAYFEQPPEVDVKRWTKRGYRRTTSYHPDFLLLRTDGPQVIQVKPLAKLEELATSDKNWVKKPDGSFQDLAAEEALAAKGLRHVVAAIDALDQQRAINIALMLRALRQQCENDDLAGRVTVYLSKCGLVPLADLARDLGQRDLTPLIRLIANHRLHTDIARYSLEHPETCLVAREPDMLSESYTRAWEQLTLEYKCQLAGTANQSALPLEQHLAKGLGAVEELADGKSDRTARRWRAKIRKAESEGISPVVALSREYKNRGNRRAKRPQQVAFATNYIKANWGSKKRPSRSSIYRMFKNAAEEKFSDSKPLGRKSFYRLLERLEGPLANDRGGNRACNAAQTPTNVMDRAIRPERPFQLATCDHYLCDQYCVVMVANGMEYVMRPWLTVLRDICTSSVLAFWLRLAKPSSRSISLVIRQCVRLHGRLPEGIVQDSGSDFRSNYYSALAADRGFNLIHRPVGHPRYGSEAERYFGQYKELWLSARSGNLVNLKEVRSVSASHRPEKLATMTLLDMWEDLLVFHDWMEHRVVDSAVMCPIMRLRGGLERFSCSGIETKYDENFIIATAVDAAEYKLDPHRGLHIGAFHYWSPELAVATKGRIPVRDDPQDPYRIYALPQDRWVTCFASPAPSYAKKSPLQQIVEGAIQLDRYELNKAIKEDSDRLLVQAILQRESASSMPLPDLIGTAPCAVQHTESVDFFSEVARDALPSLAETFW